MGNDLKKLLKALNKQGFPTTRTGKSHWLVRNAQGDVIGTISGTPSGSRWWDNTIAHLRRGGFQWPPKR